MPFGLVAKFLAAFLVLLGTSGQGLASMLCGAPQCPKTPVTKPVAPAKESCCAKKAAKAKPSGEQDGKSCCCQVESAPKVAKLESKFVLPAELQFELARTEASLEVPPAPSVAPQTPIPSVTDASPPDHARKSARSRAPPAS